MADEYDDLESSMSAFEAAFTAKHVDLPEVAPKRALIALDGSNQDATTVAVARGLAERHQTHLTVLADGGAAGDLPGAEAVSATGDSAFERIMAAAEEARPDLIVLCSPFRRDLARLGQDSVGETLDVLMSRAGRPLLVVRDPLESPETVFDDILIPITFDSEENPRAAAWALRLIADGGTIRLLAVADTSVLRCAEHLLGEYLDAHALEPELLEQLESKEHAGLIAALQKGANVRNVACKVKVRAGQAVEVVTEVANRSTRLVITSCPADRKSADYQRVQAFLRESKNPVLVV